MRFITICSLVLLTLAACDKEKDAETETKMSSSLDGTWTQTLRGYSIGGPMIHASVDPADARIICFNGKGFTSNDSIVQYNSFSVDGLTLTLRNTTTGDSFKYSYVLLNDTLSLSPLTVRCVEGCYAKYVRAATPQWPFIGPVQK